MKLIRRWIILSRCRKVGLKTMNEKKINKLILKIENLGNKIDSKIDLTKLKLIVANKDLESMKKIIEKLSIALNDGE